MNSRTASENVIGLIVCAVILSALSLVFAYIAFTSPPKPPQWNGPVEEWFAVGHERRKLEDLASMKVLTVDEYEAELKLIMSKEAQIVVDYPRDREDFETFREVSESEARRSAESWLWTALAIWIVATAAAFGGMILGWRHDRRIATEAEQELQQLRA